MLKEVLEVFHTLKESQKVPEFPGNDKGKLMNQFYYGTENVGCKCMVMW